MKYFHKQLYSTFYPFYSKNIPAIKFHTGLIWNRGALGLYWRGHPNKKYNKKNRMSSDMRSVPDPKTTFLLQ